MSSVGKATRRNLVLAILRHGEILQRDCRQSSITICDDKSKSREVTIGRLEIISAQHKSCGCSGDSSKHWSTKDKCTECAAVNEWAVTALSRKLLKFTCSGDDKIYVQGRGAHASIHVGSKLLNEKDSWSEKILVKLGEKIYLAPTHIKGTESLVLQLVLKEQVEDVNKEKSPQDSDCSTLGRQNKTSVGEVLKIPPAHPSDAFFHPAKRKNHRVCAEYQQCRLFLVPLGHDMSSVRRRFLATKAFQLGVPEADDVFSSTHIMISQQVTTLREVSLVLNVKEHDLRSYIEQNDILCVLPRWIVLAAAKTVSPPEVLDLWHGDTSKRQCVGRHKSEGTGRRQLQFERNNEIAEIFRTLSNLHQSCPLLEIDQWKAYMFRIIAGRLCNLDFEIRNDPAILNRLRKIPGIGSNSVDKIQEFLETGKLSRIEAFGSDSQRVAMKNMMSIWGVGRKTALDLIHRGFRDISDVRTAIREGKHFLDRNQLVGVDCYEDILEEMERDEVKLIGDKVKEIVQEIFPNAEVQIMGSYRRQKATCGDIDIHITDNSFVKKIPDQGLSRIVDLLWKRGLLAYHLTFLPGMETGLEVSDYLRSSRHVPKDSWKCSMPVGYMSSKGSHGSSYMGVARSPQKQGKYRRIDIKFYPWRDRAFAYLYFTGNGFFNRSMRLWASRKFGYTLNDRGLFYRGTTDRVMEASSEMEVFNKLNLIYKEPHERDSFDAVVSKAGPTEIELSQAELKEETNYVWVK